MISSTVLIKHRYANYKLRIRIPKNRKAASSYEAAFYL